ncbi:AAA family ATPase [Kitasatospora terrestris]|uniref:HTH luxR-type domain-containing protein n=1 Tax=Kitasatospora terrestris TaxID=258051 RepID=A0ABP9EQU6_9ACTN
MSIAPVRSSHDLPRTLPAGREAEYRHLAQALDRCEAGVGTVVALHGSVGSGRSELLYSFSDVAAERGATVLMGTGSPLERDFPLGLARQLLQSAPLDPTEEAAAETLLAQGAVEAARRARTAGPGSAEGLEGRLGQPTLEGLFGLVRGLAARGPVLIAVDDRQDADPQSLEFLLYLVRRTRNSGVLTVLSSRETMTPPNPFFEVELARQPHHRQVRLDVLSRELVEQLVRERFGAVAAARTGRAAHELTGGNPLLVHALMDDQERAGAPADLVAGEGYRRGLMHCLHRIDPLALRYARGVAVLGAAASPALLAELLLLPAEALPRALYLLHAAGLFRDGGFRHVSAAGDLLAAMRPEELASLHERAARLLSAAGAEPRAVAGHTRAAEGYRRPPWYAGAAGEDELPSGSAEPESAVAAVQVAAVQVAAVQVAGPPVAADGAGDGGGGDLRVGGSAEPRTVAVPGDARAYAAGPPVGRGTEAPAAYASVVSGAGAAHGDAVAFRCVPSLPGTVGDGAGALRHELKEIRHLFWQGRAEDGVAALERFEAGAGNAGASAGLRTWLGYWYPSLLPARAAGGAEAPGGMRLLAGLLAGTVAVGEAVVRAEALLRDGRPGQRGVEGPGMEALSAALTVLLYADRADRAAHWCGVLSERGTLRCGTPWQALYSALRAEAALRQGDLRTADEAARAAFAQVTPDAWGVAVGLPLSTMVAARTALGLHQDAARFLELAVPDGMARTPGGLHLRYARAGHLLAVGRAKEALGEYRACGDTMARWGLEHLPAMAPWRLGAARAQLALGRPQAAAFLADQQLARLGEAGPLRLRGQALWIRAAAGERAERTALLEQAVELLEEAGAEADLAGALAELSQAQRTDGDPGGARLTDRRLRRSPALSVVPALVQAAVAQPAAGPSVLARPQGADPAVVHPALGHPALAQAVVHSPVAHPAVAHAVVAGPAVEPQTPAPPMPGPQAVAHPAVAHPALAQAVVHSPVAHPAVAHAVVAGPAVEPQTPAPPMPGPQAVAHPAFAHPAVAYQTFAPPAVAQQAVAHPVPVHPGAPQPPAGARPAAGPPAEGLSDAERRVVELAVRGLSNRDIARKLFITVSTVEQHLTKVYRKLGVRRRVDLAAVVGGADGGAGASAGGSGVGVPFGLGARGTTGVA